MSNTTKVIASLGMVAALGVAVLPLSAYADVSDIENSDTTSEVTITAKVNDMISLAVDNDSIDLGTLIPGGDYKTGTVTATVKVNTSGDADGYKLTINGTDEVTDMISVGDNGLADGKNNKIETLGEEATFGSGASAWAYRVGGGAWTAIPKTAAEISADAESTGGNFVLTFGAYAADNQAAGTYQGKVTLTATATEGTED